MRPTPTGPRPIGERPLGRVARSALRMGGAAMASVAIAGCLGDGGAGPSGCGPVTIEASVRANPNNVLSAVVGVRAPGTDSVEVRIRGVSDATFGARTPAFALTGDSLDIPVLGLAPDAEFVLQPLATSRCGTTAGPMLTFHSGVLPADLPSYSAGGTDPSPGFVVFAAAGYGLAIDQTGTVRWYHRFPGGPGLNFQAQPNGRYVANPPASAPSAGAWVEIDPLGRTTRTFGCLNGLKPRFHDLAVEADGSYWIMCDQVRTMDLSGHGGVANAQVVGTAVQRVSAAGALLFEWTPFDHFEVTDLEPEARRGATVNWTHGNAIDREGDDLLVSFRNLNQVVRIDAKTGAVVWRMGGRRNEFSFDPAPGAGFAWQHGVRVAGSARLVLLDNLGDPATSRVEEYRYDGPSRRVWLERRLDPAVPTVAATGGTVQPLPRGRRLASYGSGGRVEEYDANGAVVWAMRGNPGYVFRAQRIVSLYAPGAGDPR
ncbi:MAG: arylsulfotransferase family protein [Gemmatimonadales bacterium]